MKRWITGCVLFVLVAFLYLTFSYWRETLERHRREETYQSVLASYQGALASGLLREQVENYLHSTAIHFERLCCSDPEYSASDLVEVGKEPSPWYCSRSIVYVEFHFSTGSNNSLRFDPSDRLKKIGLYRRMEDCL